METGSSAMMMLGLQHQGAGDHHPLALAAAQLVGIAAQRLFGAQAHRAQGAVDQGLRRRRGRAPGRTWRWGSQHVVDPVEGVVDLEGVLKDGLHLAAEGAPFLCPTSCPGACLGSASRRAVGRMIPSSRRASVVLPLPLSPAMAMMVGRLGKTVRRNRPAPRVLRWTRPVARRLWSRCGFEQGSHALHLKQMAGSPAARQRSYAGRRAASDAAGDTADGQRGWNGQPGGG